LLEYGEKVSRKKVSILRWGTLKDVLVLSEKCHYGKSDPAEYQNIVVYLFFIYVCMTLFLLCFYLSIYLFIYFEKERNIHG